MSQSQDQEKPMMIPAKNIKRELEEDDQDQAQRFGESSSSGNPLREIKREIDEQHGEGSSSRIPTKKIKMEVFDEAQLNGVPTFNPTTGQWDMQVPLPQAGSSSQLLGTPAAKIIKVEEPEDVGDQVHYLQTVQNPAFQFPIEFKTEPVDPQFNGIDTTDQKPIDLHAWDKKIERSNKILEVLRNGSAEDIDERLKNAGLDMKTLSAEEIANPETLRALLTTCREDGLAPWYVMEMLALNSNSTPAVRRLEPQIPVFHIYEDRTNDIGKNNVIKLLFEKIEKKLLIPLVRIYQLYHYQVGKEVPSLISCLGGKIEMAEDEVSRKALFAMAHFAMYAVGGDDRVNLWAQIFKTKCQIHGIAAFDLQGEPLVPTGDYPAFEPTKVIYS